MQRTGLVLRTFLALTATVVIVGGGGVLWLAGIVAGNYRDMQSEANRQQAERIGGLLEQRLLEGERPEVVVERLQASLTAAPIDEAGFLCLLGEDATVLCHPDPAALGMPMGPVPTVGLDGAAGATLGHRAARRESGAFALEGMQHAGSSHIVFQRPVRGAPWLVSVHANRDLLEARVAQLRRSVFSFALPVGVLLVLLGTLAARVVAGRHERRIEEANRTLEARVAERTAELTRALEKLRETQEAAIRSEKLALLGQLVSGLAHELNNPLTAVIGNAELGLIGEADPARADRFGRIRDAGQRCQRLVQTFLAFARNSPPDRRPEDLNAIVRRACLLADGELRKGGVRVDFDLAEGLPPVLADPVQVEQVVLNLVTNAGQALAGRDGGGHVRIRTGTREDSVLLLISDDGPGLPESIRERLFEPFQTTKPQGHGTGLGLSLCRRFVTAHNGRIELERTGPGGTSFRIELPAA